MSFHRDQNIAYISLHQPGLVQTPWIDTVTITFFRVTRKTSKLCFIKSVIKQALGNSRDPSRRGALTEVILRS